MIRAAGRRHLSIVSQSFAIGLQSLRDDVLASQISRHGWTKEAVAAAVEESKLPLTMIGSISPSQLVHHVMDDCNQRLKEELRRKREEDATTSDKESDSTAKGVADRKDRIIDAIRTRLEMVVPYMEMNRWHEAMALGASPSNSLRTGRQLEEMISTVSSYADDNNSSSTITTTSLSLNKAALGAIYVATELHMLSDSSDNFEGSWTFLEQRVTDYDGAGGSLRNHVIAGSAVASSLAGAAVSLAQPAVQGVATSAAASIVPIVASWMKTAGASFGGGASSSGSVDHSSTTK